MSKREFLVVFLLVMFFIPLTCRGAFAEMDVGDYTLGGYISLGGGFLPDSPVHDDEGYLERYIPFPEGFLAETDLSLKSKDSLDYYRFWMSHPGLRDQDFLLQAGKLGVYHAELEYDQLQHLYSTVNPINDDIRILVQRLRFSGHYMPTPDINIFAENLFLRRTGEQPATYSLGGPSTRGGYNFTTYLRPIDYSQNDLRTGAELGRRIYQFRMAYHLSTFENDNTGLIGNPRDTNTPNRTFVALPPSNIAHYVTGEGALNLLSYKTRLTGSFSYGWLKQNDTVVDRTAVSLGNAGLSALMVNGYISGVTRPCAPLTLRYSYRSYKFDNSSPNKKVMAAIIEDNDQELFNKEHYSYLRQAATVGADYKVNKILAFDVAYAWQRVDRDHALGHTLSNTPQAGIRLFLTDWLNLIANYSFTDRQGSAHMELAENEEGIILHKTYAGDLKQHKVNYIAEVFPLNNVSFSFNFSFFKDDFSNSPFGLLSDKGWSAGADVSWRPCEPVTLSLGYDHQELKSHVIADTSGTLVGGDSGPHLRTTDSYDTVTAKGDFKLIPDKLWLTTSASYSYSTSDFHNQVMPNLNETFANVDTWCTYRYNEHWGCKMGYIFEIFNIRDAYETLYLTGIPATANQMFNTLGGFYRDGTAHVLQGFLEYRF